MYIYIYMFRYTCLNALACPEIRDTPPKPLKVQGTCIKSCTVAHCTKFTFRLISHPLIFWYLFRKRHSRLRISTSTIWPGVSWRPRCKIGWHWRTGWRSWVRPVDPGGSSGTTQPTWIWKIVIIHYGICHQWNQYNSKNGNLRKFRKKIKKPGESTVPPRNNAQIQWLTPEICVAKMWTQAVGGYDLSHMDRRSPFFSHVWQIHGTQSQDEPQSSCLNFRRLSSSVG